VTTKDQNAATLRDALHTVAEFEQTTGLSTKEMLMCEEGDVRLAKIDPFDLMDWHYAIEQINALDNSLPSLNASAAPSSRPHICVSSFRYARRNDRELTNSTEPELALVA
jgi:hypothetical protein